MPAKIRLDALIVSVLFVMLSALCQAQDITATDFSSIDNSSDEKDSSKLSLSALQVGRIIGAATDIARLSELTASMNLDPTAHLFEELMLRQRIIDAVVVASLDVDSVLDELDYEREQTVELISILRARRDRALGTTNLGVLAAGTGLGIVGGVLSFSDTTSGVGSVISFASGGIATLFSLRSYRHVHGGNRPARVLPNMLAAFLGQPEEGHSRYPEDILTYLNSAAPGKNSQPSRKEQVLAEWTTAGRVGPLHAPGSKQKIALLTSTNAADKNLDTDLLNERAAMVSDVRHQVSQMKHDLADLLRALRR